jgi:Fe-S-cluster containining protein
VAENPEKTIGMEPIGTGESGNNATEVIGLELGILGKEVDFSIAVVKGQATLADIVPLARTICTKITDVVVESICSDGGRIPCRKGCVACCGPYLVPLSVPEALRLNEEISAAPPNQREPMLRACLLAAHRILNQKPPEPFLDQTTEPSQAGPAELNLVLSWYASLKLPCPFLCKGLCTIYQQRPMACRELFVKDSADACGGEQSIAEVVQMPVKMPNALAQLASDFEGTTAEAVILPLTPAWYEQNKQRADRTWPAVMMVKRFLEIVREMAAKNSTEAVV